MTTTYDQTPPFEERILGTELIVIGRVGRAFDTIVEQFGDEFQVQTFYEVTVEEVLKGQLDQKSIILRVVGGAKGEQRTPATARVVEGSRMLLAVSKYYGDERREQTFVPYFNSSFPINDENDVDIDAEAVKEFKRRDVKVRKGAVPLAAVRSMIDEVVKSRTERENRFAEMEPGELRERPYPEVSEMPRIETGRGGVSSNPEEGVQQK